MRITSTAANDWVPPGKDCGACGSHSCSEFQARMDKGIADPTMCPFHHSDDMTKSAEDAVYTGRDIIGTPYDFVIKAMPGEPSARKVVLPFRPDLVERMDIVPGDIVTGRPSGAGCPVQHVIRVIDADPITGVITGHVVGPAFSRDADVKDVREYHMLGFEGMAETIACEPQFGRRHSFLPGFCMMERAHTGLVNMVIRKPWGIHVRVEGIVIM